jgi:phage shock protein A
MLENDLTGMSATEAKEYIFNFIATLKMTEKEISALEEEALKWKNRVDLARSKGMQDILAEAEREADRVNAKLAGLVEEALSPKNGIADMRRQLPTLAAKERSVDPDLLEQELLMALGQTAEEAATEKAFRKLEKENAADSALEALKSKMKGETT